MLPFSSFTEIRASSAGTPDSAPPRSLDRFRFLDLGISLRYSAASRSVILFRFLGTALCGPPPVCPACVSLIQTLLSCFQNCFKFFKFSPGRVQYLPHFLAAFLNRKERNPSEGCLSMAAMVLGPAHSRYIPCCSTSTIPRFTTSAYSPSKGRNMTANLWCTEERYTFPLWISLRPNRRRQ